MQPQIVHIQSDGTVTLLWLMTWPDLNALSGPNDGPPAPPVGLLLPHEELQIAINNKLSMKQLKYTDELLSCIDEQNWQKAYQAKVPELK